MLGLQAVYKSIVKENYELEALRYQSASELQKHCFSRLMSIAQDAIREVAPRVIVDLGCGAGAAIPRLKEYGLLEQAGYIGVDHSPQMIALAKASFASEHAKFVTGDIENLDLLDSSADLVMANAVLHWLNRPKLGLTPAKTIIQIARVLRPGGLFIMSVAARGKALRFRGVYRAVMERYRAEPGFNEELYLEDPIGCFDLHELVDLAHSVGFNPAFAHLNYQPTLFPSPYDYGQFVRAYGFVPFMAPLPSGLREKVWAEIEETFAEKVGRGPYWHDYYINYMVARKPPALNAHEGPNRSG